MNKIFKICNENSTLKSALTYIIANGMGNTNPYHSLEHTSNVFLYSVEGSEYHETPEKERLNLLIAALFHDFNHSGGESVDSVNIMHAKSGVLDWAKDITDSLIDVEDIHNLIDITEFPYNVGAESLNQQQKILRDSDMGSIFTDNWFQTIMLGLSSESKMDLSSFLEQQRKFMSNLNPNSEWFTEVKMPLLEEKLEDLELYAEFIS